MPNHPTQSLDVQTRSRSQMLDITRMVEKAAIKDVANGYVIVYVPHTTAGITIQENADPHVQHDLLGKREELAPKQERYYQHAEGNSDSHLKTAMVGISVTVLIEAGKLIHG